MSQRTNSKRQILIFDYIRVGFVIKLRIFPMISSEQNHKIGHQMWFCFLCWNLLMLGAHIQQWNHPRGHSKSIRNEWRKKIVCKVINIVVLLSITFSEHVWPEIFWLNGLNDEVKIWISLRFTVSVTGERRRTTKRKKCNLRIQRTHCVNWE